MIFSNDKFWWKRILIEFFCCPEYRNLWSPLPETLLNNLDPAVALADLANIVLHPDIKLPVQVYHEKKTTTDVTINCLESDDLQGFKPLSKSSIGDVSDHFFRNWRLEVPIWNGFFDRTTRGMKFDPVLNMYAKWTLIHLRGITYYWAVFWSRV